MPNSVNSSTRLNKILGLLDEAKKYYISRKHYNNDGGYYVIEDPKHNLQASIDTRYDSEWKYELMKVNWSSNDTLTVYPDALNELIKFTSSLEEFSSVSEDS